MELRTVKDLSIYLQTQELSPERLAEKTNISNMTLRRLLKKSPQSLLPEKYRLLLNVYTGALTQPNVLMGTTNASEGFCAGSRKKSDFTEIVSELESSGRAVKDFKGLEHQTRKKLKISGIAKTLKDLVSVVLPAATSSATPIQLKAICAGALLYFINPIDLIPDTIPMIGYLDDFAILSLVTNLVAKEHS